MQTNQAYAQSAAVYNRQHADLRWTVFHQTQSVKSEHLRVGDDRIRRHQIVAAEVGEGELGGVYSLQRAAQVTVGNDTCQAAIAVDHIYGAQTEVGDRGNDIHPGRVRRYRRVLRPAMHQI